MSNNSVNGFDTVYYNNGNIKYQGFFTSGRYDGKGKLYNTEGVLEMEGKFYSEKSNQEQMCFDGIYYNNGILDYIGKMVWHKTKTWKTSGRGKSFYQNGNIECDGWFQSGKFRLGTLYHPDTKMKYEGKFSDGQYEGFGTQYDLCGEVLAKGEWRDGSLNILEMPDEYRNSGFDMKMCYSYVYIGEILDIDTRHGYGVTYERTYGKICEEGNYQDNKRHGIIKHYDEDVEDHKIIEYIGNFANDELNGYLTLYHENGKQKSRAFYEKNDINNYVFGVSYHKNGDIDFDRSYKKEN